MKTRYALVLGIGSCLFLPHAAMAHGGQYRGPADVVPPGGGSKPGTPAGPTAPTTGGGPPGPSVPAPTTPGGPGPTTPGGTGGGGPPRGATTGGITLEPDLATWDYWWEFNKDRYLNLKDAVHRSGPITGSEDLWMGARFAREATLRPTREQLRDDVLPALHRAIESTDQRDIASSCMVAMAKIGMDHPRFKLVDVFRERLRRPDQELRETAALVLGIAARGDHDELSLLIDLARDGESGRRATGGEVDTRTRAFATYGLGLFAHEHADVAQKRRIWNALRAQLDDGRVAHFDLRVAAISAAGILAPGDGDAAARGLRDEIVDALIARFEQRQGAGEEMVQAHCPIALARLVGKDRIAADRCKTLFANELRASEGARQRGAQIHRSCVLALGQLCAPHVDERSEDAHHAQLLWQTWRSHRDDQTRHFAVLALGQIGGAANRTLLLTGMRTASKSIARPWFALALGVLAHAERAAAFASGSEPPFDEELCRQLAEQFEGAKEPGLCSALAIALGLAGHRDAAPALESRMLRDPQKEDQAGYAALGLALMDSRTSIVPLRTTLAAAGRRPTLLRQSAVALGLLGDKGTANTLLTGLGEEHQNLATFAALSGALGLIGDRSAIEPLRRMLADDKRSDLSRAFAAVALGSVADRAPLPWFEKFAANLNYRAATSTLTNRQSGILDIL